MAKRVQALCRLVGDRYDGDAAAVWTTAADGRELLSRIGALPGFGDQKAKIFVALLGKQLGVTPSGWREACARSARRAACAPSPTSPVPKPASRSATPRRP
jgi:uncharacterized HhH-GPD family protein